jgi:hypothetical protein
MNATITVPTDMLIFLVERCEAHLESTPYYMSNKAEYFHEKCVIETAKQLIQDLQPALKGEPVKQAHKLSF